MSESDIALLTNQSSREVARGVVLTGLTLVGGSWDIDSNTLIDLKDTDSGVSVVEIETCARPVIL